MEAERKSVLWRNRNELILQENFKHFDLNKLPTGWKLGGDPGQSDAGRSSGHMEKPCAQIRRSEKAIRRASPLSSTLIKLEGERCGHGARHLCPNGSIGRDPKISWQKPGLSTSQFLKTNTMATLTPHLIPSRATGRMSRVLSMFQWRRRATRFVSKIRNALASPISMT